MENVRLAIHDFGTFTRRPVSFDQMYHHHVRKGAAAWVRIIKLHKPYLVVFTSMYKLFPPGLISQHQIRYAQNICYDYNHPSASLVRIHEVAHQKRPTKHFPSNSHEESLPFPWIINHVDHWRADTSRATNHWDPLRGHKVLASKSSLCAQRTVARAYT